jgi:hypothetical protein
MSSVKDTMGAQDGAMKTMVIDSETPISIPAKSGPNADPSPPSMTTAKTTPIHV